MLYLHLNDEVPHESHPVTSCAGDRVEGDACLPQCLGHYEWGTEGENGVLEAIPLFRGATKVSRCSDPDDPCRTSEIALVRSPSDIVH